MSWKQIKFRFGGWVTEFPCKYWTLNPNGEHLNLKEAKRLMNIQYQENTKFINQHPFLTQSLNGTNFNILFKLQGSVA